MKNERRNQSVVYIFGSVYVRWASFTEQTKTQLLTKNLFHCVLTFDRCSSFVSPPPSELSLSRNCHSVHSLTLSYCFLLALFIYMLSLHYQQILSPLSPSSPLPYSNPSLCWWHLFSLQLSVCPMYSLLPIFSFDLVLPRCCPAVGWP